MGLNPLKNFHGLSMAGICYEEESFDPYAFGNFKS